MREWRLTKSKEYKLYTTNKDSEQIGERDIYFDPVLPDKPFVKVKLIKANLSVLDVAAFLGKGDFEYPIVPARSAVAYISESYDSDLEQGRKVFLSPYDIDSKGELKIRSYNANGYLGDYAYVPVDSVYPIPEGIKDDDALFVEDIAVAISVLSKLNVQKGEYVILQGASYQNILIAQVAIYYHAIAIIVDTNDERLEVAANLGVYYTINVNDSEMYEKISEITSGKMVDKVICHIDINTNIESQISLIKNGGKIALYGYDITCKNIRTDITPLFNKNLEIIGIHEGMANIHSAINLLANGIVKTDGLIEYTTPFINILEIMKASVGKITYYKSTITFE